MRNTRLKGDILRELRKNYPDFTSGEALSAKLGISRAGIWKHISVLRNKGYVIDAYPRRGYRLREPINILDEEVIRKDLGNKFIGCHEIYVLDEVTSTNIFACDLAEKGASEGVLAVAETQTKGRGRLGRFWESPPRGGLYFSIVLRPQMRLDEIPGLTLVMALAVLRTLDGIPGIRAVLKWPNDIFVSGRKICGILAETRAHFDRTDFIVLGVGINVNTPIYDLPDIASSIKQICGKETDRCSLLGSVLKNIETSYIDFISKGFIGFRQECLKRMDIMGKMISVAQRGNVITGVALDIDERGALLLKDADEQVIRLYSGDVSI